MDNDGIRCNGRVFVYMVFRGIKVDTESLLDDKGLEKEDNMLNLRCCYFWIIE